MYNKEFNKGFYMMDILGACVFMLTISLALSFMVN